jgi:replication-associated recombination protein RarA
MTTVLTRKNYDFFEASSAMQKAIRRNEEKTAIFFAIEIAGSGYSEYVWKRLMVICSEDIGLANNSAVVHVTALYASWKVIFDKNPEEGTLPIIHAVMILCRSQKSRIIDNVKIWALKTGINPEIPEYALDFHTRRGKILGKTLKDFVKTGSQISNAVTIAGNEFYQKFAEQFFNDKTDNKIPETGYSPKNVFYGSVKAMRADKSVGHQATIKM